jgi:hypothetical protein
MYRISVQKRGTSFWVNPTLTPGRSIWFARVQVRTQIADDARPLVDAAPQLALERKPVFVDKLIQDSGFG